nr:MAG TPA: hypothetical protein [Caudoviricetes sp.]
MCHNSVVVLLPDIYASFFLRGYTWLHFVYSVSQ